MSSGPDPTNWIGLQKTRDGRLVNIQFGYRYD
jgi:hypothetical protein